MTRTYKLPRTLPGFVEIAPDQFRACEELTVDEWRTAKQFESEYWRKRSVIRMVKLADLLSVPGDVPLLPYLRSIASDNVAVLSRH